MLSMGLHFFNPPPPPDSGAIMPAMPLNSVDLPAPLG